MIEKIKERLEKSSLSMYNLLRKVIGCIIRLPSVKFIQRRIASTLDGGMLFLFIVMIVDK